MFWRLKIIYVKCLVKDVGYIVYMIVFKGLKIVFFKLLLGIDY